MGRILNRGTIEEALRRAAEVAINGPRSSRVGRVLVTGPAVRLSNGVIIGYMSSTAIDSVGYDPEHRELRITFKSDRTYVYEDVPVDTYEELLSAESRGTYFNHNIRDAYEYREVR